jgi:hypothetical protein
MNARLMPATITNIVADRPITVIPAIVGSPASSRTSQMFAASIEIRATPRATSTPMNRFFAGAAAAEGRLAPAVLACMSVIDHRSSQIKGTVIGSAL